jgi:hypothetical protein
MKHCLRELWRLAYITISCCEELMDVGVPKYFLFSCPYLGTVQLLSTEVSSKCSIAFYLP